MFKATKYNIIQDTSFERPSHPGDLSGDILKKHHSRQACFWLRNFTPSGPSTSIKARTLRTPHATHTQTRNIHPLELLPTARTQRSSTLAQDHVHKQAASRAARGRPHHRPPAPFLRSSEPFPQAPCHLSQQMRTGQSSSSYNFTRSYTDLSCASGLPLTFCSCGNLFSKNIYTSTHQPYTKYSKISLL